MSHAAKTRFSPIFLLALMLALPAAGADWTYSYSDDFSSDKAQSETYLHSTFWAADATALPEPYLQYLGTGAARGLAFMDCDGVPARVGYCLPVATTQTHRIITGALAVDVSFPCNANMSQFPAGELSYSTSSDGLTWSGQQNLHAGQNTISLDSTMGTCYVLFSGARAMIDNVRVSLSVSPATIRVPGDYGTIQQAIDAARMGDVIEVAAGTYTGSGNWDIDFRGKRITVRSASGAQSTIIDCGQPAASSGRGRRGFYFHQGETADSVLSGFTIRGGRIYGTDIPADPLRWTQNASHPIGGGIYCEFSSPTIAGCVIRDCGAELGGGIGCIGGDPTIINCTVEDCLAGGLGSAGAGGRGGGIALVGEADAAIIHCTVQGNTGYSNSRGAGLYVLHSSAAVAGCTLSDNLAPGALRGGGAYCGGDGSDVTFQNCVLSGNLADAGAGVFVERTTDALPSVTASGRRCSVALVNCTIAQNGLTYSLGASAAGGVNSTGADIAISNSIVWDNDGTALTIVNAASSTPVTYSNIQGGYSGMGNLASDPLFASSWSSDFHLQSNGGRYNPQTGAWVSDIAASPCIDAGDPRMSAEYEPAPNGDRIDMGAYGGTAEASKSAARMVFHVDVRNGRDWNNGSSQSRAFATIQAAIDVAGDGDTVLVWPGVYEEQIMFRGKAITVQSAADAAVITAPSGYACSFSMGEDSGSVLANFVITGCEVAGIFCDGASPTLKNLTIVKNGFGVIAYGGANPDIVNCIIWENTDGPLFQCSARYSCIDQTSVSKGVGNINSDPLFADSQNGDYHLRSQYGRYVPQSGTWALDSATSPCIDKGDPSEDPRGERMPNGTRINMGAYGGTLYASLSSGPACP